LAQGSLPALLFGRFGRNWPLPVKAVSLFIGGSLASPSILDFTVEIWSADLSKLL
jgi:hypothetical protein